MGIANLKEKYLPGRCQIATISADGILEESDNSIFDLSPHYGNFFFTEFDFVVGMEGQLLNMKEELDFGE